ncbi:hypothetical protein TRFO_03872 [Tritrichomonas foetus]|uniref:SUN domain-containing protein n=1 Tax=Tritrichomonas foetus TaxID=1144522 RepID=A0A1J4KPE0_9EUKA|nr:hypothetical protein TRFO_03872 [Tritrichomonas foetus]|eukprot:OHT11660.1 hypothetical protein TRFO_03872 [Tritrichomonas foetus]
MIYFLLSLVFSLSNDLDVIQSELSLKIEQINKELEQLSEIRTKLSLLNPANLDSSVENIEKSEEEKKLILVSVNSSRTREYHNLQKPHLIFKKDIPIPEDFPTCWVGEQTAPLFTFRPFSLTAARFLVFEPTPEIPCAVKQLRFEFYHDNELMMKSKVIDLLNGFSEPITVDLETEVVFDQVVVNVIQNWGDDFKTCLTRFHVYGPRVN